MRITGGRLKGRILYPLRGLRIRPTSDRVREAIFSILGQNLVGIKVLDLFAGTGSLGLEALSRGAIRALFVDNSPRAVKVINENLVLCRCEEAGAVLKVDLRRGLPANHGLVKEKWDLVFLDPPYGRNLVPRFLGTLSQGHILSSNGCVIVESSKSECFAAALGQLQMVDTRSYGDTRISIYAREVR
jgi:16S rRNA (guanine966-N2)-methyltransferase